MFKERDDKWTRQRGFWEVNGPDFMLVASALVFLALTVIGVGFIIFEPTIPGLKALFSDPPAPRVDVPLHLAPGETEIKLYAGKPVQKPAEPKK